jgi:hypothetical protein
MGARAATAAAPEEEPARVTTDDKEPAPPAPAEAATAAALRGTIVSLSWRRDAGTQPHRPQCGAFPGLLAPHFGQITPDLDKEQSSGNYLLVNPRLQAKGGHSKK